MTENGTSAQRAPADAVAQPVRSHPKGDRDLENAQRLAALGRLALGSVHDFKNALTCILSFNELASSAEDPAEAAAFRQEVHNAAWRATRLTQQILALGGNSSDARVPIDVDEHLRSLVRTFERIVPVDITVRSRFASASHALIDPVHFGQLVLNLATNARDAMPEGGVLSFDVSRVALPPGRAASLRRPSGEYVQVAVSDSGSGMNTSTLNRIYEPFFTTKAQRDGTGLGMSVVRHIVDESRGVISIDTDQGRGTTVRVLLPVAEPDQAPEEISVANGPPDEAPASDVDALRGTEHILVIDRDPAVRRALRHGLERLGYRVTTAPNPSAISELDPAELGCLVAPSRHVLARLLASWSERAPGLQGLSTDDPGTLLKPFTSEQLARAIRERLDLPS